MKRFALGLAALLVLPAAAKPPPDPPDSPVVTTLAGSGGLGITDGPATRATFISPAGLSYDRAGNLYIADRAAQRIRKLSRSGVVSTLAGAGQMIALGLGAEGGYRDGPAAQALFNMPEDVLALDDGSVLVADTKNLCLRLIRAGVVSTFAGALGISKGPDGPRQAARFNRPISLAKDGAGNIYVADPPDGVRAIDRAGMVTTLHFPDSPAVTSVAQIPNDPDHLLVATATQIERLDLKTLAVDHTLPLNFTIPQYLGREAMTPAGPVSALAAFADDDYLWTDPLESAIRLGQSEVRKRDNTLLNYTRVLTAVPPEDASLGFSAFRDGPGAQALVNEPMGIAIAPDGTVAVADTGNRRIRRLGSFNHLTYEIADDRQSELPSEPDPHEYRIALVGPSYIWANQSWHGSIPGITEDLLRAGAPGAVRVPRVLPIMRAGTTSPALLELIDGELSDGVVDMVVLALTPFGVRGDGNDEPSFPPGWQDDLKSHLVKTAALLRASHIPFVVLVFPGGADLPTEMSYNLMPRGGPQENPIPRTEEAHVQYYHDQFNQVLKSAGVTVVDAWPALIAAYASPDRAPLFAVWDHHFSHAGREVVGKVLAQRLLEMKPWSRRQGAK
jgi:hypothetical protein